MLFGYLGFSHHHGDQLELLDQFKRWSRTKARLCRPLWPHNAGAGLRGRGGSRAGTVTSSFPLRGECAASNHPIQPKLDNWGLNGGKFKTRLRKGFILVKTHGLLALDNQGHQQ